MINKKIINSVIGAIIGALTIGIIVQYAEITIYGDKSTVFLPVFLGVPIGSSTGHMLAFSKQWKLIQKIIMVVGSSIVCSLFSYVFIWLALSISEKHVDLIFLLQFVGVIFLTNLSGNLINKHALTRGST